MSIKTRAIREVGSRRTNGINALKNTLEAPLYLLIAIALNPAQVLAAPPNAILPVESRSAIENSPNPSSAAPGVSQAKSSASSTPSAAAASKPSNAGSSSAADSNIQWELFQQLQTLQQEMSELRGLVESQYHSVEKVEMQQRDLYLDLDRRILQIEKNLKAVQSGANTGASSSAPGASAATSPSGAVATGIPGATATQGTATSSSTTHSGSVTSTTQGVRQQYLAAVALMRERKMDEALAAFQSLLAQGSDNVYTPNIHYWLGELYMALNTPKLAEAKQHFQTVLQKFPAHNKVPATLYKMGVLNGLQGDIESAKPLLRQVIQNYPSSSAAKLAKEYLDRL